MYKLNFFTSNNISILIYTICKMEVEITVILYIQSPCHCIYCKYGLIIHSCVINTCTMVSIAHFKMTAFVISSCKTTMRITLLGNPILIILQLSLSKIIASMLLSLSRYLCTQAMQLSAMYSQSTYLSTLLYLICLLYPNCFFNFLVGHII